MKSTATGPAAALLLLTATAVPAHPVTDAEALALEISGELLAPPALVSTVDTHLQAIRAVEPILEAVQAYPPWEPGVLLLLFTPSAFDDYLAGTYTGLDSLNAIYGPAQVTAVYEAIRLVVLEFDAHYNGDLIAAIYGTAPGIANADPGHYGMTDTDITPEEPGTYTFRYGWFDCPLGCVYNHYWTYAIDANGGAVLVDEWGNALVGVAAPETTPVTGARLGPARPSPFRGSTRIPVWLPIGEAARLDVVDAAGRHVRGWPGAAPSGGVASVAWDGRDDAGQPVAAGVYFLVLRSENGVLDARRVVVLR